MELVKIKAVVKGGVALLEGGRVDGIALPFDTALANGYIRCKQFLEVNGYREIKWLVTNDGWESECEDLREVKELEEIKEVREVGKIVEELKELSCVKNVHLPEGKGFAPVIDLGVKGEKSWLSFVYFKDGKFKEAILDGKDCRCYSLPYARRLAKAEALNINKYKNKLGELICVIVESDFGECFGTPKVKKLVIELSECLTGKSLSNKE